MSAKSVPPARKRRKVGATTESARDRLLNAADELFYKRGLRNVGIDEIIATAGVAKASLYSHFASKDELVTEYVEQRGADWWSWFHEAVETQATTPRARLIAVFDVLAEWLSEKSFRGCALQNACVELADVKHPAHHAVLTGKRAFWSYLTDLAVQAKIPNAKDVGAQLGLLAEGAILTSMLQSSGDTPARNARAAAVAILGKT